MTPYLQVIAQEWAARADNLARWAFLNLVNRTDVWGSYLPVKKRKTVDQREQIFFTAPFPAARGKEFLAKPTLVRHFCGLDGHLISLHSTSADKTSRWLGIDIDRHHEDDAATPEMNLAAAHAWHDKLVQLGFDPLLLDSNGNGGFHLLIVFAEPIPTADVFGFGAQLIADYKNYGLPRQPETYPKQVCMEDGHYGNCLRLLGRHHTREHFARVWSGELEGDQWLEGTGAIERILSVRLAPRNLIPVGTSLPREKAPKGAAPAGRKQRPRVCVDLDGVLAAYDGWRGLDFTGQPLPGAVEFTRKLSEFADVIIYTTRCAVEPNREELNEPTRPASDLAPRLMHNVRYWLEKYQFKYTDIFAGQGKPVASAYVDDRAVFCAPQADAHAFTYALDRIRQLCSRARGEKPADLQCDERLEMIIERWHSLSDKARNEIAAKAQRPQTRKAKRSKR
jgi:hypothetical protein